MTESVVEEYPLGCLYLPHQFRFIYQNINNNETDEINLDTFKNSQIQFLTFQPTIINYLLSTCTSKVYQKLIQTCKYFYFKYRITVIPSITLIDTFEDNQEAFTRYTSPILPKFCYDQFPTKIWITKFFQTCSDTSSNLVSNFCPKIYKCEALFICIKYQNLTEKEFNFLVQPKFVLDLLLCNTVITKENDDNFLPLENIIGRVPNTEGLWISEIYFTSNTFSELLKLQSSKNKIESFLVKFDERFIPDLLTKFDYELFFKYITKTVAPKGRFDIIFISESETTEEIAQVYQQKTDEYLSLWTPEEEKPEIYFFTSII